MWYIADFKFQELKPQKVAYITQSRAAKSKGTMTPQKRAFLELEKNKKMVGLKTAPVDRKVFKQPLQVKYLTVKSDPDSILKANGANASVSKINNAMKKAPSSRWGGIGNLGLKTKIGLGVATVGGLGAGVYGLTRRRRNPEVY